MSRESSLWDWLSKTTYPRLHMTRVENGIDEGTPDVEGCFDGPQFWCELKVANRPARPTTCIRTKSEIKLSQLDWLHDRWSAGGLAWMLIQVGERHKAKRYLIPGCSVHLPWSGLTEENLARICVLHQQGSTEPTAWDILKRMTWR